ncbi:NERD domain-containing protein [Bacillus luteolus]|uniref:NERD domain-containing protein n=1 Tax=Litchfieldia luteola TaxID=682179 RepID=A0ABR9QI49_9BACI|nr:nuclease-related domain-containing protein [Cytobacillus luteolus]MBE4907859.1 NERD domain-containing protein [Cytobacillus luteolus]MBP1943983.1 hypothetical protein [Cytobacillus luteolus]
MGKFIGRDRLLDILDQVSSRTNYEIKGIKGELSVGDLLAKYLPEDTFIIAQPTIGKYEPDFLIISPRYGFRLVEVKNWSIHTIKNVQTNGTFTVLNKSSNPTQQVRKHVDDLKGYLLSNHSYIGDPHKLIGYVTIQYGFIKSDVLKYTKNWDSRNAEDFFKFHLFRDELNSELDSRLANATKFIPYGLQEHLIDKIVSKIRLTNKRLSDSEIDLMIRSEEIERTASELKELAKTTKMLIEEQKRINSTQINDKKQVNIETTVEEVKERSKSNFFRVAMLIIVGLIIVTVYSSIYLDNDTLVSSDDNYTIESDVSPFTNINIEQAFESPDNYVKVSAVVKEFFYEKSSGNKFLKLEVNGFTFNAIIYSNTEVPYINTNESYTIYGVTQKYEDKIELKITTVE